ncbi:FG-GAP-like repeat-containing protein [Candidatus Zixiibacteriota bacterium]
MTKVDLKTTLSPLILLCAFSLLSPIANAQPWLQNDQIFNPSGIPSLTFSQPRLADLDADSDFDLILGNTDQPPLYFQNSGSPSSPSFGAGPDIFSPVSSLDAEMGVCADLDADGDLDLVTGGYTGLHLFENVGDSTDPEFDEIEDFFSGLSVGSNPAPTLADLDADGDQDLLVGLSENGALVYYPNSGAPDSAVFLEAQSQTWYDVGLYAYPWFADLDNDADFDLLVGRDGLGFYYYRNDGDSTSWLWQPANSVFSGLAQTTYWNSPCLIDLSGDGKKDLIYGTAAGPLNYYINTGSLSSPVWTANTSLFGGVLDVGGASSPFLFDFDDDGDLDLVSGSQLGDIKYYRNIGLASAPAWEPHHDRFAAIDHSIYSAITLGDTDGDSLADAVVGDTQGQLFFHRNTGTSFTYDSSVFTGIDLGYTSVPRLIDMDTDGDLDIVAGNEDGNLFYFRNNGTSDSAAWAQVPGFFGAIDVGSYCSPTVADIDGDGDMDVITGDLFDEIQFFENVAGTWVENDSVVAGIIADQNAAPAFGDLDDDGDLDLTIGNYGGTFSYYKNLSVLDSTPPQPVADLTVSLAGDALLLQWSAVTTDTAGGPEAVQYYVLYRGETADFLPTVSESLGSASGIDFLDSSVSFSPAVNFFYLVKAVDAADNKSAESVRAGEFDRELLSP